MSRRAKSSSLSMGSRSGGFSVKREALGFFCLLTAAFYYLCLLSFDPMDPSFFTSSRGSANNLGGMFGSYFISVFVFLIGGASYFLGLYLVISAFMLFTGKRAELRLMDILVYGVCAMFIAVFLELKFVTLDFSGATVNAGGTIGKIFGDTGVLYLGRWGMYLIVIFGSALTFVLATRLSLVETLNTSTVILGKGLGSLSGQFFVVVARLKKTVGRMARGIMERYRNYRSARIIIKPPSLPTVILPKTPDLSRRSTGAPDLSRFQPRLHDAEAVKTTPAHNTVASKDRSVNSVADRTPALPVQSQTPANSAIPPPLDIDRMLPLGALSPTIRKRLDRAPAPPKLRQLELSAVGAGYELPSLDLLDHDDAKPKTIDEASLKMSARVLEKKLKDFSIDGQVTEIHPGPVITMYEFQPAPGVKISRIHSLTNDLSLAMGGRPVRIGAPLPNKAAVGIEIPNYEREIVWLKDIIADDRFQGHKSKLVFALGKDIEGVPHVSDLERMPHLLVAGTTGSGKSVAVNSMICSILYKATPDEVRLIMIDPKMIELSIYDGIPHLLLPVVTDSKKAHLALKWAVREMERRYQLMSDVNTRNLTLYNKKIENGEIKTGKVSEAGLANDDIIVHEGKFPHIVVIVDEFADLMMVSTREVEDAVCRLAQKARAAGIHVILATQRPSVDVITGVIKANFPARIAFRVSSSHDSRTIMNTVGAEHLLGMGDMLFIPPGASQSIRLHGAYVSEKEITKIIAAIKAQGRPVYDESILEPAKDTDDTGADSNELDEFFNDAVEEARHTRRVSISSIQRRFRIGYNRAARIVDQMEMNGIVTPPNSQGQRQVVEG